MWRPEWTWAVGAFPQVTPTGDTDKPSTPAPKPGAKDEPAEDATSRLLKAKRRARRDMDDRNQ